jgi:hypothetical protein
MNLTPRQMLILVVLIVGFGVAAYVVSREDSGSTEFDQARWCGEAGQLEGAGEILRGTAADVTEDQLDDLRAVFFDVETIAPFDLWRDIAALADFTLVAGQQRADFDWPTSFAAARENKDATLDAAIDELELELATCGVRLG